MKIKKESRHSELRFLVILRGPPESMFFNGLIDTGSRQLLLHCSTTDIPVGEARHDGF